MPRERKELFRESKIQEKEKVIVLAFEGNDTERIYFEEFKGNNKFDSDLIYLHLLKRPKDDTNSAPNHVFNKLKREAKEEYNFNSSDELWMIIDKDRWRNIPQIIDLCNKQSNMFVALSNPCFEFWLLLHIKDFQDLTESEIEKIIQNPKVSNHKRYLDKYLGQILENGYNKSNPLPHRFFEGLDNAIQQAKALDINNSSYFEHLGSRVYLIMEKIRKNEAK